MAKTAKTGTSGYVTESQFAHEQEQLQGQKRFQVLRGLKAEVETASVQANTKEIGTRIATEGLNQANLKLEGSKYKTDTEKQHTLGLKADLGYTTTEYQLKAQTWELKLQGHRQGIEQAKAMLQAQKSQGLPGS